jgi:hypothetical protein
LAYSEPRCSRSKSAIARPGASRFASARDKFSLLRVANALLSRASNLVNRAITGTAKCHASTVGPQCCFIVLTAPSALRRKEVVLRRSERSAVVYRDTVPASKNVKLERLSSAHTISHVIDAPVFSVGNAL